MFTINTHKGMKMIPKITNEWAFTIKGENLIVKGSSISRPSGEESDHTDIVNLSAKLGFYFFFPICLFGMIGL